MIGGIYALVGETDKDLGKHERGNKRPYREDPGVQESAWTWWGWEKHLSPGFSQILYVVAQKLNMLAELIFSFILVYS